jgi:hypothetical protein
MDRRKGEERECESEEAEREKERVFGIYKGETLTSIERDCGREREGSVRGGCLWQEPQEIQVL